MNYNNIMDKCDKRIMAEMVLCRSPLALKIVASENGIVLNEVEAEVVFSTLQLMRGKGADFEKPKDEELDELMENASKAVDHIRPLRFI